MSQFSQLVGHFRQIPRSLKRFAVSGALTVAVDAAIYSALLSAAVKPTASKALSLVAATVFAYIVNRFWTFEEQRHGESRFLRFATLYALAIALNVGVNFLLLQLFTGSLEYPAAWICATGASSVFNYLGLRYAVFPVRGVVPVDKRGRSVANSGNSAQD